MGIADELAKLKDLHDQGALSDAEYAQAKEVALAAAAGDREARDAAAAAEAGTATDLLAEMTGQDQFDRSSSPALGADLFDQGDRSLGHAANRYVSFQITMTVVGLLAFLLFFVFFFLPGWTSINRQIDAFPFGGRIPVTVEWPSGR